MTLLMRDQENFEKGIALGIEQEEKRIIICLYLRMVLWSNRLLTLQGKKQKG